MNQEMLTAALSYLDRGFSVIPVGSDKKPLISWSLYQERHPTEYEVRGWLEQWPDANIAICTGQISGVSVIDIDEVGGEEEVRKIIGDIVSPTVLTPRGGKHLYFKSPTRTLGNNTKKVKGCDFRGDGGYIIVPPSVMPNGVYQWNGNHDLDNIPVLPSSYVNFVLAADAAENTPDGEMFRYGRRDDDVFHVCNSLAKSGMPRGEIVKVAEILGRACFPPLSFKEVIPKVDSAVKRNLHRAVNVTQDIRDWTMAQEGIFTCRDCYTALQLTTREEKKYVSDILGRLEKEGVVAKCGNKSGTYRSVNDTMKEIDWMNVKVSTMDVQYPLGLHELSHTYPKNIVVIAGAPNSGKTAFLLNFLKMNMDKYPINYFSSEMGDIEFNVRLQKFGMPKKSWKFKAYERVENFDDVIKPDEINIIDYLEVYDDFWRIADFIRRIHDKLDKGIALIAIQKNPGRDTGIGGAHGLHKPRLYLSMDRGVCRIIKGKSPKHQDYKTLDGLFCEFDIKKASNMVQTSDWRMPEQ